MGEGDDVRTRPPYTPVKLYYDGGEISEGDYMQAMGKRGPGQAYLIEKVTLSPTIQNRRYLSCLRWPADKIPEGVTVHEIHWYGRKKKSARRLSELAR